jgi:hypothetical protein
MDGLVDLAEEPFIMRVGKGWFGHGMLDNRVRVDKK